jgi:hypothetical protein
MNPRARAEGHAFTHAVKSRAEWRYRSAEGRSEARRAKRLIIAFVFAVVLALAFFSAFSAPKTHVKSQNIYSLPSKNIRVAILSASSHLGTPRL